MNWFNKELQTSISQKLMEMGNLSLAALTFGALLSEHALKWWVPAIGLMLWFVFYLVGIILGKGGDS
ncbi:hypothetical protein HY793_03115 [Candidatus Desantisbacteria bacterium]|nr:hypothetical protein [Candidatus Desantisbacteria bacterium]